MDFTAPRRMISSDCVLMSKEQVPLSAFVSVLAFFLKLPRKASLLLWNKGHVAKVQETDASEKLQKK
jgi:hypothetical protein